MENPKRTNYIFVDFENTQVVDIGLLAGKAAILLLVVGEKQKHLPISLVKQLLTHADQVGLIESTCVGKNALDFILAYHVGQWVKQDPSGYFHIISKDKGFDPLIAHLQQQKVSAARHDEFTKIPLFVDHQKTPVADKIALLAEKFVKHAQGRPAKRDSLIAYINSTFAKQLPESEVLGLVHDMQRRKLIEINGDNKVTYCV
jgi:hypothetical protein